MKRLSKPWRWLHWVKREAYAWWPGLPFGLSARIHRQMRRLRWERSRIKIERLGQPDAPRISWKDWERVRGAQARRAKARSIQEVLERKEKK